MGREDQTMRVGMIKCRDVIIRNVGAADREYDKIVVEKAIREMARVKEAAEKAKEDELNDKKQMITSKRRLKKVEKKPEMKKSDRKLLGKYSTDVLFLEKFVTDSKKKPNVEANRLAIDALKF